MKSTFVRRISRLIVTGTAALAFTVAPTVLLNHTTAEPSARPCYNGVVPWAPYIPSCTLPGPQGPRVRGAAPDANAIIACRDHPGCLSWYVNGPF
jgi:hypothetical protein